VTGSSDMGTSTCFYTKLSQRPKEQGIVSFYFIFVGIIFLLLFLFVFISVACGVYPLIWPGQQTLFIYLALGLGIVMWSAQIINLMTDAYGFTVAAELLKVLQKFLGFLILIWLYAGHYLKLHTFFIYNYIVWIILLIFLITLIHKNGYLRRGEFNLSKVRIRGYISEFWCYCNPLLVYSLVGLVTCVFDRWILQVYGGSAQQGFYSLSYQIGAVCFLFTGAMAPLFMRELSIAHANNDLEKMRRMFRRYVPILYTITAYFSCFVAVMADKAVYIFGGSRFSGAIIAVAIMAFYPIHQTYGQLSSSVFYATSQTKTYRNIGIVFLLLGVPVTYFLIAPHDKMGLNAGATGLAVKMVLLNIISVNVQLYFNAKQLQLNYWRYLWHQIITVGILFGLAIGSSFVANHLLKCSGKIMIFFVSGIIYSVLVIVMIYILPAIIGLRRKDILSFVGECKGRLGFATER